MRPPSDIDYTIAKGISDTELLVNLAEYFATHPDSTIEASRQELAAAMGRKIDATTAEQLFTGLVLNDAARQAKPGGTFANYRFHVDTDAAATVLEQQAIARGALDAEAASVPEASTVRLVATTPPHINPPSGIDVVATASELRQLVFDVDEVFRLATPYIDSDPTVIKDIASLPRRGISCRLLTRELSAGNANTKTAVTEIYDRTPASARQHLTIVDLFARDTTTGNQQYATHAKVAIADSDLCYIGSANMTATSLNSNFELGVLLSGPIVKEAISIFDRVFDSSEEIEFPL